MHHKIRSIYPTKGVVPIDSVTSSAILSLNYTLLSQPQTVNEPEQAVLGADLISQV